MNNSRQSTKNQMVLVSTVMSVAAVILLFFPIISLETEDIFSFKLKYNIAGFQFIFGSGNGLVDFIIDNAGDAKAELAILGVVFMAVPAVLSIVSAVVRYICREKKAGSLVPVVLGIIAIAEPAFFFAVTSYIPAVGMILFMIVTGANVVLNILVFARYDKKSAGQGAQSQPAAKKNAHLLKGVSGAYAGAVIEITEQPLWIGRDSTKCSIVLEGAKVSRQHCCIWLDRSGSVMFKDTSTNGVYFPNGDRMLSNINMELHSGDTIYIGNSENSFQIV